MGTHQLREPDHRMLPLSQRPQQLVNAENGSARHQVWRITVVADDRGRAVAALD